MKPTINPGQYVLVRSSKNIKPDDIIICRYDKQILVKRIQSTVPGGFMVKGDNPVDSLDSQTIGLIYRPSILGKVLWY